MTRSTDAARPRHRAENSYSRGEETRRRLIEVAIRLFGERGFEGASTRDIARLAEVNSPALQYYFDNKEGLYLACVEHMKATSEAHFGPTLDAAEAVLQDAQASREALLEAFHHIQDAIADYLLRDEDQAQPRRLFLAQEQAGRGGLAEPLYSRGKPRVTLVGAALVARLSGRSVDDPLTLLRLITANGQLMVFHVMPRAAMEAMGWQEFGEGNLRLLKQTVRAHTRALVDSWTASESAQAESPR
ncbi:MAG TPA: CerR family C-terminal domain-containing protein [Rhodocyclaceae bacterium]|nr:CerR family C-terminal domain-containing protein [Rhodocyclaceae bacterium]